MEQTILEVIAAHARRIPEKIALISENETLTYKNLWQSIQNSAKFLRAIELHFPICTTENLTEKLIDK